MTSVTRKLGRIAAVGAIALLLAGAAVSPAEARPTEIETDWLCDGGDAVEAVIFKFMGVAAIGCLYPNGEVIVTTFP